MNQELAEKLLSKVMNWGLEESKENVRYLEDFAELKYDQYQQFEAGSRFIENLALWLNQFESQEEKDEAYNFICNNLVFISRDEMLQLIQTLYLDLILPKMKEQAIKLKRNDIFTSIPYSDILKTVRRQSLFMGLSDGARLDIFRRSTKELSNEQVCINHELSESKITDIFNHIEKDTKEFYECYSGLSQIKKHLFGLYLLDDFSGSGISYLRNEGGLWKGKIYKVLKALKSNIDVDTDIHIILYLATNEAKEHLLSNLKQYTSDMNYKISVHIIQEIHACELNPNFESLLKKYTGKSFIDEHWKKGKSEKYYLGFNECSLPLVIYHNTPNNSFPIIWEQENPLFERVTRHKEMK